ncbi:ABC transporter ATP-binding protein [Alkalicoccobacillus murimartini]|uniref:ATP-binding cassette subfamily B protein AbcA/BmrA n=1 Tax=Alkalicoccobacillus murimartini TaxID=171685 RepID=A0ABT9YJG8_9BACI|nr:ABC transporter ATP-binding protein [Alkalicoccobacillus murimartini]MDQ0207834.1 ATP-binding cassette subfamily B protein AbcA/BmrA [Alkalicoccobacillus murimartini]
MKADDQSKSQPPKWREFWQLLIGYRPSMWLMGGAVVLGLGETILSLLVPLLTMQLVDILSVTTISTSLIVLLIAVFLAQATMSGFSIYMMTRVGQHMIAKLREDLWKHVIKLPIPFFDKRNSGETMSRITNDTNVIKEFVVMQIIPFFSGLVSIIGSVILLFIIDWKITLMMLVIIPVAFAILMPLGRKMYKVSKATQDETAEFQGDLGRVLSDIRLVKSSLAEPKEEQQGKRRITKLFGYGLREAKINAFVTPLMMTVNLVMLVFLIGYGGFRVSEGTLSAGSLVAIILYMFQIIVPFSQMATFFTQSQKAMGATERIREIMDEKPELEPATSSSTGEKTSQEGLIFKNVNFGYSEDQSILHDLSFSVGKGKVTAFVGPSGAGKTTIFSLIERFYQPKNGSIHFEGVELKNYQLREWRSKIAYVSQESPMMAGTIRDNLTYGLEGVTDSQIDKAVDQANLREFINKLPDLYDTQVGERGVKVSGGQRQRLAIARAIIRDPELLLLDEATAHLDSTSESLVQEALQGLMEGRTTLVIAHRLSTVRHADRLIVLEQGQATGIGTHEELIRTHDVYREMVEQQFDTEPHS